MAPSDPNDPDQPRPEEENQPLLSSSQFDLEDGERQLNGGRLWGKIAAGVVVALGLAAAVMYFKGLGPFAPTEPTPAAVTEPAAPSTLPASQPASAPIPPPPPPPPMEATKPVVEKTDGTAKKGKQATTKAAKKAKKGKKKKR